MLRIARTTDPSGDYRAVAGNDCSDLAQESFDLVLCAFPFDNIPAKNKAGVLSALRKLLAQTGTMVNVVSSPEI